MELKHIAIAALSVSAANMRARGKPDIASILPSVRARGVLVPLIVRANGSPDSYEIVAGKRRYHAALAVSEETGSSDPLPCAVIEAGDDAAALEASLIENIARLDPDEVTRWETFTRLGREGRSPEEIGLTFGLTELQVKRTLALGNLMPRIRSLYRQERLDPATVRHLTLASKQRQREWLALYDDPDARAPVGSHLKAWLFGGASIPVSAALFDLATYPGEIVTDLFGEGGYFANADTFRAAQNDAIDSRVAAYEAQGWPVIRLAEGEHFHLWEHERCAKRKGGKVFVAIGRQGEVAFHEGYISLTEARKRERGETVEKAIRPEIGKALDRYIDLHRHAATRAALAEQPGLALRVMVAHAIHGSPLWHVQVETQQAPSDAIAESVENSAAEAAFDQQRRAVLSVLGFDLETPTVTHGDDSEHGLAGLIAKLVALPDEAVMAALAVVMAETLAAGTPTVELIGNLTDVDMAKVYAPDDALLDLIRDREVLDAVLAEVAGDEAATANAKATGKVKRQIVRDCLTGENGRAKVEGWVPNWMAFPPASYTDRGGVSSVRNAAIIADLVAAPGADPLPLAA